MRSLFAASLLVLGIIVSVHGDDSDSLPADEQTLKAASLGTDGPALIEFFKKNSLTEADRENIRQLIKKLGDKNFRVREKASADLVSQGPRAIALLRPA